MSERTGGVNEKCIRCANKLLWFGLWDSFFLAVFKGVAGYLTHSRVLTMSAIYSLHDVIAEVSLILGRKVADIPANVEHPYGHGEMENIVSVFNGLVIFGSTLFLMVESIHMLLKGHHVPIHWAALGAAVIATLANWIIYRFDHCVYEHINSPAMLIHAKHHHADAISSVAAVIAILGTKVGWYFLDALVSVFEAVHLLYLSGEILLHAGSELLDRSPHGVTAEIEEIAARSAGQGIARHVIARHVGRFVDVDLYLELPPHLRIGDADRIADRIRYALGRRIKHIGNVNVIYQ